MCISVNIQPMRFICNKTIGIKVKIKSLALALTFSAVTLPLFANEGQQYSLDDIIELAIAQDHGLSQMHYQSLSLTESGVASTTQMDPKFKIGFGGLPADSFKFDEDAMTNISVGLAQQFSRGDSLRLSQQRFDQQAEMTDYQIQSRKLDIARNITRLWVELQYLSQSYALTIEMHTLMKEMTTFIETNYSLGKNEAQDLLYVELQVSQLDENLQKNLQMQQRMRAQMSEWINSKAIFQLDIEAELTQHWDRLHQLESEFAAGSTAFFNLLLTHPNVLAADKQIQDKVIQTEIAQQAYTPQFGIEVGYAYRQADSMNGEPASDLVSAYLTMDLPLFVDKRQDRQYAAAQHQVGAAKSQKDLLLIQMNSRVNTLLSDKANLEQRLQRYQDVLVVKAQNRTKAVERGYENNTVQFGEWIKSSQDELMIAIEQVRLQADLNNTMNELAYTLNRYDQNITELNAAYALQKEQE
jgi:outer membrane protein TolC